MSQDQKWRGVDRRRVAEQLTFPLLIPSSGEYVLSDRRSGYDRRKLGSISRQPIFKGVPFGVVESLVEFCEIRRLDEGEQLLTPHRLNAHLFLLIKGDLRVHIDQTDSPSGIDIKPGEFTGEISIIDGKPATAYVIASKPSVVLAIPEMRFWGEFMRYPRIAKNFMQLFAERFRERNDLIRKAIEERHQFEAMERELAIAAQIQTSMLPRSTDMGPEFDVFARVLPARHVGGDFYDVSSIDNDRFYVAVGDVAGKGVPASLFMVKAMTVLRAEMLKQNPLEGAIAAFNRELCKNNDGCMFVTLAIVEFDRRTKRARYASAGHTPLAIRRAGNLPKLLQVPEGILAGIEESAEYGAIDVNLEVDDVLVFYTDGVTEAMNDQKTFYTERRLLDTLRAIDAESSEQLGLNVISSVEDFVGGAGQADDLTLAVVRFR